MTGLFILLVLLAVTAALLTIAIGGNANLAAENRRLRAAAAQRRHPALRAVGTPVDHHAVYSSTCACSHQLRAHDDLGCDGDPACTCSRDSLTAALDAGLVRPVVTTGGGAA